MPRFTIHHHIIRKPIDRAVTAKLTGDVGNLSNSIISYRPYPRTFRKLLYREKSLDDAKRGRTSAQTKTRVVAIRKHFAIPKSYSSKVISRVNAIREHLKIPKLPTGIDVVDNISELREKRSTARSEGKRVALVPTMGALHRGHLALIRQAAIHNDEVFVSIYVNPTQFGVHEDLDSYPRTWEADMKHLRALNADIVNRNEFKGQVTIVFKPSTAVMYPSLPPTSEPGGHGSFINITPLSNVLEGASRPVFFRGVATVVMKLLNAVEPDEVVFGQKDIQQVLVIRRMIADFHINTAMRVAHTIREYDGLAMSSRNANLGARRRSVASVLHQALRAAYSAFKRGLRTRDEILDPAIDVAAKVQQAQRHLPPKERARFEVDYLSMADPDTLEEVQIIEEEKPVILSGAVIMLPLEDRQRGENVGFTGGTTAVRLIDNVILFRKAMFPEHGDDNWDLIKRGTVKNKAVKSMQQSKGVSFKDYQFVAA